MEIDIKKVMGETPNDAFEAMDRAHKAQQEVIEALHIMDSVLRFPDEKEYNNNKMLEFISRFSK